MIVHLWNLSLWKALTLLSCDVLLAVSGMPYDTLVDVISAENKGSLKDYGVKFDVVDLKTIEKQPVFDYEEIEKRLKTVKTKAVFVARSRGYSWRSAISVEQIAELVKFVKQISPETLVIVDNCYGEFVEKIEPNQVGADLVAGSLIKNMGGGIVPTGGYIAGSEKWVEQVAFRLTSPSIGAEVGSFIGGYLQYFEGYLYYRQSARRTRRGHNRNAVLQEDLYG